MLICEMVSTAAVIGFKTDLGKIFTQYEIKLANKKKFGAENLAARLAAKIACHKILSSCYGLTLAFNKISVINNRSGAPILYFETSAREFKDLTKTKCIDISLTHTKKIGIAVCRLSK